MSKLLLLIIFLPVGQAWAQPRICIDHDTIVFGDRGIASSNMVAVTVSNCGDAPFRFTDVSVHAATTAGFSVSTSCVTGALLPAGAACTADVRFEPSIPGQQSGALWLRQTTSTPSQLITFYGRGTGAAAGTSSLSFSPSPLSFGMQGVGSGSQAIRLDLENRGNVAITPSALVVNGPAAYEFNGAGDCAVGRSIPAGGACHLDMVFTPASTGRRLANLNIDAPELSSLAILQMSGIGIVTVAPPVDTRPSAIEVIEFHHAALDHYFLTADADEAAYIDRGSIGEEWTRTGRKLRGWPRDNLVQGSVDACRFFGTPGPGPDSHFYTVDQTECSQVRRNPYWFYEGIAFRLLPLVDGKCIGSDVVQRLMKPAVDVSGIRHRYVTATADVEAMRAAGWIVEGPVFCSSR